MLKAHLCLLSVLLSAILFAQNAQDSIKNLTQFEFAYPYWSPDGTAIVFQSNFTGNWQLYQLNVATKNITRLTENNYNDVTPAWSPDGKSILFSSDRDGDDEIYILDLHTKSIKQLTINEDRDIHPNWSPDGKHIVFNSERKTDTPKKLFIQIMDSEGKQLKIIKEDDNINSYASFSPDGKKIAFLKWMEKGKNGEIFCMNADGSNEVRLTTNNVWDGWPTWSAKGDRVIFSSPVNAVFKLWSVDITTKALQQLTFGEGEDARANCRKDGKTVVFNRADKEKIDILILPIQY